MTTDELLSYGLACLLAAAAGAFVGLLVGWWRGQEPDDVLPPAMAATLCLSLVARPNEWEPLAGPPDLQLHHKPTGMQLCCDGHVCLCGPSGRFLPEDEAQIRAAVRHYLTSTGTPGRSMTRRDFYPLASPSAKARREGTPVENDMSTTVPAGSSQGIAVRAIGVLTLLWGGVHIVAGAYLFLVGATAFQGLEDDPAGGLAFLLQAIAGFVAVVGVACLVQGLLAILAGWGVLAHRPWGRALAFIVAALAIFWGLVSLSAYAQGAAYVALGAAQLLYGVLAFVILTRRVAATMPPSSYHP